MSSTNDESRQLSNRTRAGRWQVEFPYEWDADDLVSRRQILRWAVWASGALFAATAGLAGLTLSTGNETVAAAMPPVCDAVAAVPELRRNAVIDHIAEHAGAPAVFDQPERVAAELKVVSPLIDAIGIVALDVNAALHLGEETIQRG